MLYTITAVSVLIVNIVILCLASAVGVGLYLRYKERNKAIELMRGAKK